MASSPSRFDEHLRSPSATALIRLNNLQFPASRYRGPGENVATMKKLLSAFWLILFSALANGAPHDEWFRGLSLENAAASSDLILAAQVIDVTEIKLMRGGKCE